MAPLRPQRRRSCKHDPQLVEEALEEVRAFQGSVHNISRGYQIPYGTLQGYIENPQQVEARTGLASILTRHQMLGLRTSIGSMLDRGLGFTKEEVKLAAKHLAIGSGKSFSESNGMPTDLWWRSFKKFCEKEGKPISMRTPHPLSRL